MGAYYYYVVYVYRHVSHRLVNTANFNHAGIGITNFIQQSVYWQNSISVHLYKDQ